ncbi:TPA: hypothetical protein NJ442_002452 [Vibrio parahaemolyticus]|nr:hypothetical protein [Vibrio parahaemolyticus]
MKYYETLEEAISAVDTLFDGLGIPKESRSVTVYKKHYHLDEKLSNSPHHTYRDVWTGYDYFFGKTPQKGNKYKTHAEARLAAIAMFERLSIEPKGRYRGNYNKLCGSDPQLPVNPASKYKNHWISWGYYLGKDTQVPKYKTMAEAMIATAQAFFNNDVPRTNWDESTYLKCCEIDPYLPASPEVEYKKEWQGYSHFFGKNDECYSTQLEASEAANILFETLDVKNAMRSGELYAKHCHLNPRLPSHPQIEYADEWEGWSHFFMRTPESKFTLEEAREYVIAHKAFTTIGYDNLYKYNKRLPALVCDFYGLDSYREDFLQLPYFTAQELSNYCDKHKISSTSELRKIAKDHPQIKMKYDAHEGYKTLADILYTPSKFEHWHSLGFSQWAELAEEYCNKKVPQSTSSTVTRTINKLFEYLRSYLISIKADENVVAFFDRENRAPDLEDFFDSLPKSQNKTHTLNKLRGYFKYVFEQCCYLDGEPIVDLAKFRIPFGEVSLTDTSVKKGQSVKPVLPYEYVVKARQELIPEKTDTGERVTNFRQLTYAIKLFDTEWYDVDESLIDKDDPNCVYRYIEKWVSEKGTSSEKRLVCQMWAPAKAVGLFFLLNHPARGQQLLWVDSGEGDKFKLIEVEPKIETVNNVAVTVPQFKWVPNDCHLAGTLDNQGLIHKGSSDEIGMYFNTNKTGSPFVSNYFPTELIPWIIKLRDWQTKYNPISKPTKWTAISLSTRPTEKGDKELKRRGAQCFLFRDATGKATPRTSERHEQPLKRTFMPYILPRLLYRIQDESLPLATYDPTKDAYEAYSTEYSPHSMRVSLITALALYGGLPYKVLMQIVGHAQILMTLYYTKMGHLETKDAVEAAHLKALEGSKRQVEAKIIDGKVRELGSQLIFPEGSPILDDDWPKASLHFFDFGICPFARTRCHDGGCGSNVKGKINHLPTPAGFLGRSNCFQCRHLVTGAVFIGGLTAKFNEISLARSATVAKAESLTAKHKAMSAELYQMKKSGEQVSFSYKRDIDALEHQIESELDKKDMLDCDLGALLTLNLKSMELLRNTEDNSSNLPVLFGGDVDMLIELDEVSDVQAISEVCQSAELYSSINASVHIPKLSQNLDRLLANNGLPPTLFRLSEDEQLRVGNQAIHMLKERMSGWGSGRLDKAFDGELSLDEAVGIRDGLVGSTPINQQLQNIIQASPELMLERNYE